MKFKDFLKSISILCISLHLQADFDKEDVFVEWDSGRIQQLDENVSVFSKSAKEPTFLTIDISKKNLNLKEDNILFNLMVDDIRNLDGLEIRLMESRKSNDYLAFNIPLFFDYEFNLLQSSTRTKIALSGANFTKVGKILKKINYVTFYFSAKKPETRLTLWPVETTKKKSKGVLSLTFDDGPQDNLLAAKILKEYNIPATAYIMPNSLNTKGFLTTSELKFLSKQNWDIDSHHEIPFTHFNQETLRREIDEIHSFLKKNKYKSSNYHLAYPLGKTNSSAVSVVSSKFATARLASGGIETIPPADLYKLRAFNVLKTTTPKELKEVIQRTRENNQWLILMFHHIKESATDEIDYSTSNFRELAKIISSSNIEILTMNQVWEKYLK